MPAKKNSKKKEKAAMNDKPSGLNPILDGGGAQSAPYTFSLITPVILALSSPNLVTFPDY